MKNFLELAHDRYSVRAYKDTAIEKEKIDKIVEAGRIAPTARNNQPAVIYVLESSDAREKIREASPCTFGAPVVFVICYDERVSAKGLIRDDFDFGNTDAAIVCTHMMLEAADLGLGTCWVGKFVEADVKRILNLPEYIRVIALLPTGYAADNSVPSPRHEEYRPAGETVYYL